MRPPLFAAEYVGSVESVRPLVRASMRPPLFAAEYAPCTEQAGAGDHASMRPPLFAAEYDSPTVCGSAVPSGFNEAAAVRGGIRDRRTE